MTIMPSQRIDSHPLSLASPRRILVLTNMWPSSANVGVGSFVQTQVSSLRRRGLTVEVAARRSTSLRSYPAFYARALAQLRSGRYDVAHAHYGFHSALPALFAHTPPLVTTFHRGDAIDEPKRNALYATLQRRCVQKSAALIAVSSEIRNVLVAELGARMDQVHVIPCGVDATRFQPCREARPRAAKPRILWSGSWSSRNRKGLDVVLGVASRIPEAAFELVGIPPDPSYPPNCHAIGRVPNDALPQRLQGADLFLFPTRSEGTPVAVMEAMACGVPVLVSPVGGVPDLIKDGVNGFLISSREPDQVAQQTRWVLERTPETLSALQCNALQTIHESYTLDVVAERIESVFQLVLARQQAASRTSAQAR